MKIFSVYLQDILLFCQLVRRLSGAAFLVLSGLIAGCMPQTGQQIVTLPPVDSIPQESGFLVNDPLLLPMEAAYSAQRRLLPNQTALQGENFILQMPGQDLFGPKSAQAVLRDADGLPYPFEFVIAEDLQPIPGMGENYGYTSSSPTPGVTCVLVAGSGGFAYGAAPAVLMRNCVNGDVRAALAPLHSF
jgi:hypothetical protein